MPCFCWSTKDIFKRDVVVKKDSPASKVGKVRGNGVPSDEDQHNETNGHQHNGSNGDAKATPPASPSPYGGSSTQGGQVGQVSDRAHDTAKQHQPPEVNPGQVNGVLHAGESSSNRPSPDNAQNPHQTPQTPMMPDSGSGVAAVPEATGEPQEDGKLEGRRLTVQVPVDTAQNRDDQHKKPPLVPPSPKSGSARQLLPTTPASMMRTRLSSASSPPVPPLPQISHLNSDGSPAHIRLSSNPPKAQVEVEGVVISSPSPRNRLSLGVGPLEFPPSSNPKQPPSNPRSAAVSSQPAQQHSSSDRAGSDHDVRSTQHTQHSSSAQPVEPHSQSQSLKNSGPNALADLERRRLFTEPSQPAANCEPSVPHQPSVMQPLPPPGQKPSAHPPAHKTSPRAALPRAAPARRHVAPLNLQNLDANRQNVDANKPAAPTSSTKSEHEHDSESVGDHAARDVASNRPDGSNAPRGRQSMYKPMTPRTEVRKRMSGGGGPTIFIPGKGAGGSRGRDPTPHDGAPPVPSPGYPAPVLSPGYPAPVFTPGHTAPVYTPGQTTAGANANAFSTTPSTYVVEFPGGHGSRGPSPGPGLYSRGRSPSPHGMREAQMKSPYMPVIETSLSDWMRPSSSAPSPKHEQDPKRGAWVATSGLGRIDSDDKRRPIQNDFELGLTAMTGAAGWRRQLELAAVRSQRSSRDPSPLGGRSPRSQSNSMSAWMDPFAGAEITGNMSDWMDPKMLQSPPDSPKASSITLGPVKIPIPTGNVFSPDNADVCRVRDRL